MIDPQQIGLQPANELEGLMVQVASGLRSEDDFRAALHAADVVVPQHAGERGERPAGPGDEVAMRVVEVRGLRAIPAFTSVEQLERTIPDVSYVRLPVTTLQQNVPEGVGLVLNPQGGLTRLLDPLELRALPGPPPEAALTPRPAAEIAAVADPDPEPTQVLDMVRGALARHPPVRAAYRAVAARDREATEGELVVGLVVDGGDAGTLEALGRELDITRAPFSLVLLDERGSDLLTRYLLERTEPFYERDQA